MRLGPCLVEHLEQCGQVIAAVRHAEDCLAAVAVYRLHYHRAMFRHKALHFIG